MGKPHIITGKMVKLVFHYKNGKSPDTLVMTQNEFVELSKRIFEKIGIIKIKGYRYDLTMIRAIELEFLTSEEIIV